MRLNPPTVIIFVISLLLAFLANDAVAIAVGIPAEVLAEGLVDGVGRSRQRERRVVLEPVLADVAQQGLEPRHLHDAVPAEGEQRVVGGLVDRDRADDRGGVGGGRCRGAGLSVAQE